MKRIHRIIFADPKLTERYDAAVIAARDAEDLGRDHSFPKTAANLLTKTPKRRGRPAQRIFQFRVNA